MRLDNMFWVSSLRIEKFNFFSGVQEEQFDLKTTTFYQSSLSIQVFHICLFNFKTFAIKKMNTFPAIV